ncbi:MAG: glycosyltransferase [Aquabacterium sp.]|jgi:UDP-N-acetylmuramyl pentapeptide phosphotransferase/UDP-N-acetylglucosamine-1-phosphate transferase|uniref:MraY family glycosyltransferase n=1 Tax=Aquabacterium sp. TaxID=1872578 RepID=UPI003BB0DF38
MSIDDPLVAAFSITMAVSFGVCLLLVLTQRWHGRLSLDGDLTGAQKFHDVPVPRIGGVAVFAGLLSGVMGLAVFVDRSDTEPLLLLIMASLPAFLAGLLEDITKRVSVGIRLLATFSSAALAAWLVDASLTRLDTFGLDALMTLAPIAVMFTCFAVGGIANAVNIIDGFNGLASGSIVIMLAGLGAIAHWAGDTLVLQMCLLGIGASLGFMLLNYPFGKIFLGDGGAYLAGFWLAECAVLLLSRNEEVSTWAVLLACIYPAFETVFSMWRKDVYRKTGMGKPDKVHFHMLVFRRIVGQQFGKNAPAWLRHGVTSFYIWMLVAACQITAIWMTAMGQGSPVLATAIVGFALIYIAIYRTMVLGCFPKTIEPDGESPMHA